MSEILFSFLHMGDFHADERNPTSRIDDYGEACKGKLRQIVEYSNKYGCSAVLHSGDFFNRKDPRKTSHAFVNELADILAELQGSFVPIPGNHDLLYSSMDNFKKSPLKHLFRLPNVLQSWPTPVIWEVESERFKKFVVRGIPFVEDTLTTEVEFDADERNFNVIMVHAYAYPRKVEANPFLEEVYSYSELSARWPDVDLFLLGHLHEGLAVQQVASELGKTQYFSNPWSVMRVVRPGLTRDPTQHTPQVVHFVLYDDGRLEAYDVPLEAGRYDEVFDFAKAREARENLDRVERFIKDMKEKVDAVKGDSGKTSVEVLMSEVPDAVRTEVYRYLTESGYLT